MEDFSCYMHPYPGAYQELQAIIQQRELRDITFPYPHWDPIVGWGGHEHVIAPDDVWQGLPEYTSTKKWQSNPQLQGTDWTFHGDFAD
jgi:hypothetical protein